MPYGWAIATFADIADYINGRAFKPEEWETKGKPIIRIQNLNNDTIPYNYSSKTHEPKYQVKTGNLLFAWAASLGVYIWEGGDAWLNQHIFKVLPKPVIIKEYLYYLLQAKIHDLYTKTHGSGMVHITRAIFMSESVLLPPIKEQQRIVSAIKAYYALLDKVAASLN